MLFSIVTLCFTLFALHYPIFYHLDRKVDQRLHCAIDFRGKLPKTMSDGSLSWHDSMPTNTIPYLRIRNQCKYLHSAITWQNPRFLPISYVSFWFPSSKSSRSSPAIAKGQPWASIGRNFHHFRVAFLPRPQMLGQLFCPERKLWMRGSMGGELGGGLSCRFNYSRQSCYTTPESF